MMSFPSGPLHGEVLKQDFCQAFIDYAKHERAQDEIRKLCIKDENIDKYITTFECLGHHAGMDLDNPTALQLFVRGLPQSLANLCIEIENPDWKPCAWAATTKESDTTSIATVKSPTPAEIAGFLNQFSISDKEEFVKSMRELGENVGF
jgi:hypothetical protein